MALKFIKAYKNMLENPEDWRLTEEQKKDIPKKIEDLNETINKFNL
jgi:hypothetical protein